MSEDGADPDYRFTLANERTFLAWIRTTLALLAGAVAVVRLIPDLGVPGASRVIGAALAVLGVGVAVASLLRWRRVQAAMRHGEDLPATWMPLLLGTSLAVIGVGVLVLLVVFGGAG